ncbi:hypothetical protein KGF54_002851 [Candida jiufengensis]|uniref:uncharacterized protein n=1 Tax=Candida jiufengensis TaxID=497108 RepID=UPI0022257D15|nr:uncharacterized protein KGF54_002851 [Candida jiufengensis]KAI5953479.1 hypothetical protein KGF54_002851 [Candida jiufengensis]
MILYNQISHRQRLRLTQKITERIRWSYQLKRNPYLNQNCKTRLSSASTASYFNWLIKPLQKLITKENLEENTSSKHVFKREEFPHLRILLDNKCYDQILENCEKLSNEEIIYILDSEVQYMEKNCGLIANLPLSLHDETVIFDAQKLLRTNESIQFIQILVNKLPTNTNSYKVWIYYHTNNLEKIIESFFAIPNPNENTTTCFLNLFIVNYEIEVFKSFYQKIIVSTKHKLSSNLFHTIINQLILHESLFENLFYVYQLWINSPKCESPKPESIALLLYQFYKFGTYHEIKEFKRSINKNYGQHYLVQSVLLQNEIINREYLSLKKNFLENDYNLIESIMPEDQKDIEVFCCHWLTFMTKYSNLEHINYIIRLYKDKSEKDVPIQFFESLLEFYERHDQFVPLLKLIQNSITTIPYKNDYLNPILKTFIYSYSRFSPLLADSLNFWLNKPHHFKIHKISSQFYPFHLKIPINQRKYKNWSELKFGGPTHKNLSQIRFRIEQGFPVLLHQGILPDFNLVLDTFRMGDLGDRLYIKSLLTKTRQYNWKNQKTLELRSLKHPSLSQEHLIQYFKSNKDSLNDSHKFFFIRMLINFDLLEEARYLFSSIDTNNLNDKNKMMKFVMEMRMYLKMRDYKMMVSLVHDFPLEEIYLSPYLLTQSIYIENMLANSLRKKSARSDKLELDLGWKCVRKLRSFIGDIKTILKKDEEDVPKMIEETMNTLEMWRQHSSK